jgi:hypothetical protein
MTIGKKLFIFEMSVLLLIIIGGSFLIRTTKVPEKVSLSIPFTVQAPIANWDHNKDCEEASLTMVNAYLDGQTQELVPTADAVKSIGQLKAWENANIGYNKDTGASETTLMAEGAFGLRVRQITDYSANDLKRALSQNHPVLLLIDAKKLGNPKYPQTFYHVFVVRGYDGDNFIVHDPGTESGNSNVYSFETLKNAAADWNHITQKMDSTHKVALIISK